MRPNWMQTLSPPTIPVVSSPLSSPSLTVSNVHTYAAVNPLNMGHLGEYGTPWVLYSEVTVFSDVIPYKKSGAELCRVGGLFLSFCVPWSMLII